MRALALLLSLAVMLVTSRFARADGPPPSLHATVTAAAPPPPTPRDVVALTRVEGLAVRTLQPRLTVRSPVVRAVRLAPMFPLGGYLTLEYTMGKP
jgi:hypothetical protein